MKSAVLVFSLLAIGFAPLAAATGPELLAKYNFENIPVYVPDWGAGHGSTYKPATGWKTPFKVSLDSGNPHAGAAALRFELLESSPKEKIVHGPAIKIDAPPAGSTTDRGLLVRLFVRSDGLAEGGAGIRVLERDEANASIRLLGNSKSLVLVPVSSGWAEVRAEGVLHSRTRSVTFMLVVYQDAPVTVWIDDVSVELGASPATR